MQIYIEDIEVLKSAQLSDDEWRNQGDSADEEVYVT